MDKINLIIDNLVKYSGHLFEIIYDNNLPMPGMSILEQDFRGVNRFKIILEDYDTTIFAEEALHRLVEIHYKIGLVEESKKYASILGYNYQSSEWYKKSYKIFNQDYSKRIKSNKKNKKSILKKFKTLIN